MAQLSSSWRVPMLPGRADGEDAPGFSPVAEMLRAVSPSGASSHLHQPVFPPLLCNPVHVPGPPALLSRNQGLRAHLVPYAQGESNSLILSQRRQRAAWPRSSNVKAKLRSGVFSSPHAFWPLSPLVLWGAVEERGKSEPDGCTNMPDSPGVGSPAWKGKAGIPGTGDSECSVDACLSFLPPAKWAIASPFIWAYSPAS